MDTRNEQPARATWRARLTPTRPPSRVVVLAVWLLTDFSAGCKDPEAGDTGFVAVRQVRVEMPWGHVVAELRGDQDDTVDLANALTAPHFCSVQTHHREGEERTRVTMLCSGGRSTFWCRVGDDSEVVLSSPGPRPVMVHFVCE